MREKEREERIYVERASSLFGLKSRCFGMGLGYRRRKGHEAVMEWCHGVSWTFFATERLKRSRAWWIRYLVWVSSVFSTKGIDLAIPKARNSKYRVFWCKMIPEKMLSTLRLLDGWCGKDKTPTVSFPAYRQRSIVSMSSWLQKYRKNNISIWLSRRRENLW